jgi:hypothetical protein
MVDSSLTLTVVLLSFPFTNEEVEAQRGESLPKVIQLVGCITGILTQV